MNEQSFPCHYETSTLDVTDLYISMTRRTSTSEQFCCQEATVATVCLLTVLLTNLHGSKVFLEKIFVFFEA